MPLTVKPHRVRLRDEREGLRRHYAELLRQIDQASGVLNAHPHKYLRFVLERHHFFKFEFVVHHEEPDAELHRITNVGFTLDGVRVEAFARLDAALFHNVDLPIGAYVERAAFGRRVF